MVRLIECNWRTEVLNGKTVYDPQEDESIMEFYRQWVSPCQRCIEEINYFVSKRFEVQGSDKFQRYCMEAKNILSGHNPFFDDADNADHWAKVTMFLFPQPRPVRVDDDGRMFEESGNQLAVPGLDQERVLRVREEMRSGQRRTLKEVIESQNHNGIRDISQSRSGEGTSDLPVWLQRVVEVHLQRLAQSSPADVPGVSSCPSFEKGGMVSEFDPRSDRSDVPSHRGFFWIQSR